MKDCWTILDLQPTDDLSAIKKAYREQVKRYHPDRASAPDQKQMYTAICAEINQAYRQAIDCAQRPEIADEAETAEQYREYEQWSYSDKEELSQSTRGFAPRLRSGPVLRGFLFFFIALELISLLVGPIRSAPEILKTSATIIAALFIVIFIYGIIFAGTMDLLIFWLFSSRIINRLKLEKYESEIAWLAALAANIAVFFFTGFIPAIYSQSSGAVLLDLSLRGVAAVTAPALLALNWIRESRYYQRNKASLNDAGTK